ncbi:MAG: SWIM zinc finger family protein [Bradymonadales bacterium]|nr:SWIM zinc finger family protein [Bradymonadales bacterium]
MRRRRDYWSYYDDYPRYTPSSPIPTKGGIKARSKRGAFGESWWARRWIAVLESFHIGARLSRGRNYARQGQVTEIDIVEGMVTAKVQGSRAKPYKVTIRIKTLGPEEWTRVARAMGGEALLVAKLLAGEMPQEIETVFQQAGLSLFPSRSQDLQTDCSCPDWSNPCKHIAAVYYLIGEEFDRDPFLLFKIRGLDRSGLLALLGDSAPEPEARSLKPEEGREATGRKKRGGSRAGTKKTAPESSPKKDRPSTDQPLATTATASPLETPALAGPIHPIPRSATSGGSITPPLTGPAVDFGIPLPSDPALFWRELPLPAAPAQDIDYPQVSAALLRRLGGFPFWRGNEDFLEALLPVYENAAEVGLDVVAELTRTRPNADNKGVL